MSEERPTQSIAAQAVDARRKNEHSLNPQLGDARCRLHELLAIPDRERTDALWDEIVRLELELGPGNRAPLTRSEAGRRPGQARRQQVTAGAKPTKRYFKLFMRGPRAPTKT